MIKTNATFSTDGSGYWSNVAKPVIVKVIDVDVNDDEQFGEMRVYFDTKTWDIGNEGLIYTDKLFLKNLRSYLDQLGLPSHDVCYSEQGMQGDDYVSLDIGAEFIREWGRTDWWHR
jgi:hypothetical protein